MEGGVVWWTLVAACTHAPPSTAMPAPPPPWLGATTAVGDLPAVVAVVNGQSVSADELRAFDPGAFTEAEAALAEARRDVLDRLVIQTLVHQQAQSAGMEDQAWLESVVAEKSAPVTDADVERFYADNADQIAQPLPEVRESLRGYLADQRAQEVVGQLITGLRRTASVESRLPRFRVAVDASGAPRLGPDAAPVQIVEFSDFQCPYCAKASGVMQEVLAAYGDRVSLSYRHFPLDFHPQARAAAQAAVCAQEQDRFWPFHDALFADRERWSSGRFDEIAEIARLDVGRWRTCLESPRAASVVDADLAMGQRVGASGTPAFFVNGIAIGGAQPFEAFAEIIDEELAAR